MNQLHISLQCNPNNATSSSGASITCQKRICVVASSKIICALIIGITNKSVVPVEKQSTLTLWTTRARLLTHDGQISHDRRLKGSHLPNNRIRTVERDNFIAEIEIGDTIGICLDISEIPNMSNNICWGTVVLSVRIEMRSS